MILNSDARAIPLRTGSVHCVVTSPPYWGLRDYGLSPSIWDGDGECPHDWDSGQTCRFCGAWRGQLGLEPTPDLYIEHLVDVFREVGRVLRDDGTLWLNLGDSYAASNAAGPQGQNGQRATRTFTATTIPSQGLKPKDLVGIPWRVAFALQAEGWYLRSDIIWSKPNPMPESVTDRPTKAHEYMFLLSKSPRYYYDAEAIKEPPSENKPWKVTPGEGEKQNALGQQRNGHLGVPASIGRNRRTVWEIATQPYPEAHFATFPEALVEPCVMAGTSERGVCRACGAQWGRVSGRAEQPEAYEDRKYDRADPKFATKRNMGARYQAQLDANPVITTGWQPSCACAAPTTQPLVLDPFAGSGTVGQVCHRLGRRFVGLELNATYCGLAWARTAQLGLV